MLQTLRQMRPAIVRHSRIALTAVLWCAALGLLIQNYLLIRQNREITARTEVPQIQAGRQLEALTAIDAGGALATVKLPSTEAEKLLIITFSPVCPACRKNTPGWRRLTQALRGRDSWRVVWVSRNLEKATRQYCEEQRLPLANVFWDPSHRTYLQLGLESVPNIMAVDYGGVVRKIWAGVLDSQTWKEIAEYTNVPYQSILDEHALLTEHAY